MKRGISAHWDYDRKDKMVLVIEKKRGKLTLDEIQDAILHPDENLRNSPISSYGWYTIILNCNEGVDMPTWGDSLEEKPGDIAILYPVNDSDDCPVCGRLTPPFQYCPECGHDLRKERST